MIEVVFILMICSKSVFAQSANLDFEKVKVGDAKHILVGVDLSPNGKTLAISSIQGFPLYTFNVESREVINKFDVGNWYAGSSIHYSANGNYLLMQQLFYTDLAPNKDREVNFELINMHSGKRVLRFDNYHAVTFTPDEKFVVSLTAGEIAFWSLKTFKKEKTLKVNFTGNAIAISPDGKHIAISRHPVEDELKNNPRYKNDKKGRKYILKYKHQIAVYNAETLKYEYTVNEFYDIIYRLEYSNDGKTLFCLQIPHLKANPGQQRQTFINTIDAVNGKPLRKGFMSRAIYEPDFKLSPDGKLFGVVSQSTGARQFPELHIYDFESGKMLYRFELTFRLFEKAGEDMAVSDNRTSFVFLPDNTTVVFTMGNRLVYWHFKSKNR